MDNSNPYVLDPRDVEQRLGDLCSFYRIRIKSESTSTNDDAKAAARQGEPEGLVIIADRQTAGRGRMHRAFFSPDGTGLYMSVLLRPAMRAADSVLVTAAAAVAVAEAIEQFSGRSAMIKWVNDIFLDGKKVCGILTEGSVGPDGTLQYAVLGIGVNVAPPPGGFPEEIHNIACAVFERDAPKDARAQLAAEILKRFHRFLALDERAFLPAYRQRSLVLGMPIMVSLGEEKFPAKALSIDDDCRLIVKTAHGVCPLCAGEVSIRPIDP
jgi:BirA family transcriptional regulator, biotin operon repressor / biotin---[acetyl-CoA-carboxylase] ligase